MADVVFVVVHVVVDGGVLDPVPWHGGGSGEQNRETVEHSGEKLRKKKHSGEKLRKVAKKGSKVEQSGEKLRDVVKKLTQWSNSGTQWGKVEHKTWRQAANPQTATSSLL